MWGYETLFTTVDDSGEIWNSYVTHDGKLKEEDIVKKAEEWVTARVTAKSEIEDTRKETAISELEQKLSELKAIEGVDSKDISDIEVLIEKIKTADTSAGEK